MKALSIMQPWASAILHLGKRLENRGWQGCSYRGPLLLHASKGVGTITDFDYAVDDMLANLVLDGCSHEDRSNAIKKLGVVNRKRARELYWAPGNEMPRGGIVGVCRVESVIPPSARSWSAQAKVFDEWVCQGGDPKQKRWWMGGFALVLKDVRPLPFLPWKGALGLFEVPDNVVKPLIARAA